MAHDYFSSFQYSVSKRCPMQIVQFAKLKIFLKLANFTCPYAEISAGAWNCPKWAKLTKLVTEARWSCPTSPKFLWKDIYYHVKFMPSYNVSSFEEKILQLKTFSFFKFSTCWKFLWLFKKEIFLLKKSKEFPPIWNLEKCKSFWL